jgi:heme exporter protein A
MNQDKLALDVRSVSKMFGRRQILTDISFTLKTGEFLLIVGPNGAGKTTLLKILATLLSPGSGDAFVSGFSVKKNPTKVRERIGFISHNHLLYRDLTTYENLKFYGEMYGVKDLDARIDELLNMVELNHRRYDTVRNFSRGMFQRLAIARALLHKPEIMFLDEPHTGLDPHAVDILDGMMRDMSSTTTFVMVTHHIESTLSLGTQALILDEGKIQYCSDTGIDLERFRSIYGKVCGRGIEHDCD